MNRLYVVECTPTLTGAAADHRLAVAARDVALFASAIAAELGLSTARRPRLRSPGLARRPRRLDRRAGARPEPHRGPSLVIAGETQPAEVHALAHLINHALGNVGKTVEFIPRVDAGPADQIGSLRELVARHERRRGRHARSSSGATRPTTPRPTSTSPSCWPATRSSSRSTCGLYDDETAQLCHWHVPEAHCLETVERPARLRRHGDDPAAPDRAALQGQVGPRAAGGLPRRARPIGAGDRPRLLAAAERCRATSSRPGGRPSKRA